MKATVTSVSQSGDLLLVTLEVPAPAMKISTTKGVLDATYDYSSIFALKDRNTDGTKKYIDVSAFTVSEKSAVDS